MAQPRVRERGYYKGGCIWAIQCNQQGAFNFADISWDGESIMNRRITYISVCLQMLLEQYIFCYADFFRIYTSIKLVFHSSCEEI